MRAHWVTSQALLSSMISYSNAALNAVEASCCRRQMLGALSCDLVRMCVMIVTCKDRGQLVVPRKPG